VDYYREAARRIHEVPGVLNVAVGSAVPWRDAGDIEVEFSRDGHVPAVGEEHPHATFQVISPGFFAALGLPVVEGRDFTDSDSSSSSEPVAIVSQSPAQRTFPNGDALNHYVLLTDPILQFVPGMHPPGASSAWCRILTTPILFPGRLLPSVIRLIRNNLWEDDVCR
jgi:hypothetical protein